jgi:hypothetical protein
MLIDEIIVGVNENPKYLRFTGNTCGISKISRIDGTLKRVDQTLIRHLNTRPDHHVQASNQRVLGRPQAEL